MNSRRWVQLGAIGVTVAAIVVSAQLSRTVTQTRQELQLASDPAGVEGLDPVAALAAQMGSFRGIAVNLLWQRIESQKQAGRFFEANTLAEQITRLQPRFPQVWAFQAWNMAYNISVKTSTPAERWDWVSKGVRLLREKGIPLNPDAIRLYRELHTIYLHKIGGVTDDMNKYYKARMAERWHTVLGDPRRGLPPELSRDQRAQELLRRFAPIRDMTESYFVDGRSGALVEQVDRATPVRFAADYPEAGPIVDELASLGYGLTVDTMLSVGKLLMYRDTYTWAKIKTLGPDKVSADERGLIPLLERVRPDFLPNDLDAEARGRLMADSRGLIAVLTYLRAHTLIAEYRMDPRFMYGLMEKYAPMDWRTPGAHALYWAALGVDRAYDLRDRTRIDQINTDRGQIHALQMLFRTGAIVFDPLGGARGEGSVSESWDILFIEPYDLAFQEASARAQSEDWSGRPNSVSYAAGHENFMQHAVVAAYLNDPDPGETLAREYHARMLELYHTNRDDNPQAHIYKVEYELSMEDFVFATLREDMRMSVLSDNYLRALLYIAFEEGLAENNTQVFSRVMTQVQREYEVIQAERSGDGAVNAGEDRRGIEALPVLIVRTFAQYMNDPGRPLFLRSRAYRFAPNELRVPAYDLFIRGAIDQATAGGRDWQELFPPPPGLAAYRQARDEEFRQQQEAASGSVERQ
ncbi:MAG: hypothetical protein AAF288_03110 [Planctomycetota bacterium]